MGPGRWGSRGDQSQGVKITYSDIRNTSMLVEIAQKQGDYIPEPSFGTHFFQDLIEAQICYLPLYPDETNMILNLDFIKGSQNILAKILPEFSSLEEIVHVVDIPDQTNGSALNVYMNIEQEQAIAVIQELQDDQVERREINTKPKN
jgi:hypothetical protein